MAAPGSLQGPAQPPAGPSQPPTPEQHPLAQKRANFHTAQSASLKGKSHFPGRAGGSASLPSLAGCHRAQMWKSWAPASLLPPKQSPTPRRPSPQPKSQGSASVPEVYPLPLSERRKGDTQGGCWPGGDQPCLLSAASSRKPGTWFCLRLCLRCGGGVAGGMCVCVRVHASREQ